MLKMSLLLIAALLVTGCARELIPINHGEQVVLEPDEGLFLFALDNDTDLEKVVFTGKRWRRISQHILNGTEYVLVVLPAGKYKIAEFVTVIPSAIAPDFGEPKIRWEVRKDKARDWDFRVEAGKTNYAGHLRVGKLRRHLLYYYYSVFFDSVNRSSFAYEYVKKWHPEQLEQFPMVFTGFGEDGFFSELAKLSNGGAR